MYILVDEYGVVRGQTSDQKLVNDLKEALESLGCQITVCERIGVHDYE